MQFNRPPDRTKPEQILSTKAKEAAINTPINVNVKDDITLLLKAAKILRKDISSSRTWTVEGVFDDFTPPKLLSLFCKQVIHGIGVIQSEHRHSSIDQSASILAQHMIQAFKSDKQVQHKPKQRDSDFRNRCETPLSVGLALDVHKNTRSKELVLTLVSAILEF